MEHVFSRLKYSGEFALTDEQVDILTVHHAQLLGTTMRWLDEEFRLAPAKETNWPMLTQHMVELLRISGGDAYSQVCRHMVQAMLDQVPLENPFVAASMAEAGLTDTEAFGSILERLLEDRYPSGLIFFGTGFLGLGDYFSTLWSLRLLVLAGKAGDYAEVVDKAVTALEEGIGNALAKADDFVGFLLCVVAALGREKDDEIIDTCLERLLGPASNWRENSLDLRGGAFVAYDLLVVSPQRAAAMEAAEEWLEETFALETKPETFPNVFVETSSKLLPDVWLQGWLRALVAAGLYLRLRRPQYHPVTQELVRSVQLQTAARRLAEEYEAARPFLPAINHMRSLSAPLREFWEVASFEKSVFVMRWMGEEESAIMKKITQTICDELAGAGFEPRLVDGKVNYNKNLWTNTEIYMRGCKWGVAVFERIQRGTPGQIPHGPNDNVLVELGFMLGKGSEVLLLYDQDTMTSKVQGAVEPPEGTDVPAVIKGTIRREFRSSEPELPKLRSHVADWASRLAKKLDGPEEGNEVAEAGKAPEAVEE